MMIRALFLNCWLADHFWVVDSEIVKKKDDNSKDRFKNIRLEMKPRNNRGKRTGAAERTLTEK